MAILIRRAKLSDAEDLAKLYLQFWEPHKGCDPLIMLQKKLTLKNQILNAKKDIQSKKAFIFLAVENDDVLGFIELLMKNNDKIFKIKKYGYINACVTEKKFRGKGIARQLTSYALKFFKSKKIKYIRLNVYNINQVAIDTWYKLGFKPQSINMFKKIK